MAKDYMKKLAAMSGAVNDDYNPYNHVVRTTSPSCNFALGGAHGLPFGYTIILYGPPKGGKSLVSNSIIGSLHGDDPDAHVVKFDTEYRERLQMTSKTRAMFGIDPKRYKAYSTNKPGEIFDRFIDEFVPMVQDGWPLRLLILDSTTAMMGRSESEAGSIDNQFIGDHARTLQTGLKRILPYQREHNIAVILTTHVRAEMDPTEQKRNGPVKMQASWAMKHYGEYFCYVDRDDTVATGRSDELGNEFTDKNLKDIREDGKGEMVAQKHRLTVKESSSGPRGRQGRFTFHRHQGIINVHEEVFLLGVNRKVIEKPNQQTYAFGDRKWVGRANVIKDLEKDTDLQKAILAELMKRDQAGIWASEDGTFQPLEADAA